MAGAISPELLQLLKRFGTKGIVWGLTAALIVVAGLWALSHFSAKPGTQVSILFGLTNYTKNDNQNLSRHGLSEVILDEGKYEWQWAGESWLGYVNVNNNNQASLIMGQVHKQPGEYTNTRIFYSTKPAKLLKKDSTFGIEWSFIKDERSEQKLLKGLTLTGLKHCDAWVGRAIYSYEKGNESIEEPGDVVLIKNQVSGIQFEPSQPIH